jgi:hypothetical protein
VRPIRKRGQKMAQHTAFVVHPLTTIAPAVK